MGEIEESKEKIKLRQLFHEAWNGGFGAKDFNNYRFLSNMVKNSAITCSILFQDNNYIYINGNYIGSYKNLNECEIWLKYI